MEREEERGEKRKCLGGNKGQRIVKKKMEVKNMKVRKESRLKRGKQGAGKKWKTERKKKN